MLFLVAGGAGYLGSVLVPQLLAAGHRVIVLDRFYFEHEETSPPNSGQLTRVRADIRNVNFDTLGKPDVLVDLAGISNDPACEIDPSLTVAINLEASSRLARQAFSRGVSRVVFASSCSVYGHGLEASLDETSPRNPVSLYSRCKAKAEDRLLEAAREFGASVSILRFATLFGVSPRMRFDLAVNVMTKNAYVNRRVVVEGGGRQWRPFVHVADAARAVQCVSEAPLDRVKNRIFNVGGSANNLRIKHLAYKVRDRVPEAEVCFAPTDPDLRNYHVSFERIRSELDFVPRHDIDAGIDEVLDALRAGLDVEDRRLYRLRQYRFLAEVDRTHTQLALDDSVLGLEPKPLTHNAQASTDR